MASKLTGETVAQLLRDKIAELKRPELRTADNPDFERWLDEVEAILRNRFGPNSIQLKKFKIVAYPHSGIGMYDDTETRRLKVQIAHEKMLPKAEAVLEAIIFELDKFGQSRHTSRYELTSFVYWAECFRCWKPVATVAGWFKSVVGWVKGHLLKMVIAVIIFVAAILGIVGFYLEWLR